MDNAAGKISKLSVAEKFAGAAAIGIVFAYLVSKAYQGSGVYPTCAILGAAGVLVIIGSSMAGMSLIDQRLRPKLLIGFSVLPLGGFIIDVLSNFWYGLLLLCTFLMAYAALLAFARKPTGLGPA